MSNLGQDAAIIAVEFANDDRHGYDQENRNGPDYDCSFLVIAIYKMLGVDLTCTYTGDMYQDFTRKGFVDVLHKVNIKTGSGCLPGDVLLCASHTAIYVGSGKIVAARINELGKTTGGKTGDQTGQEICIQSYYNYPWTSVLRYGAKEVSKISGFPWVSYGSKGANVAAVQGALLYLGILKDSVDGDCGDKTSAAIRAFQKQEALEVDGIAGDDTISHLFQKVRF